MWNAEGATDSGGYTTGLQSYLDTFYTGRIAQCRMQVGHDSRCITNHRRQLQQELDL